MRALPALFACTLVLALVAVPTSVATGTLHAGPLVTKFDNGKQADCEEMTGLCLVSTSGDEPTQSEYNASQDVSYLGVALDREAVNGPLGFELLPGADVLLKPSDHRIDNPIYMVLIASIGEVRGPAPLNGYSVFFYEEHAGYSIFGPSVREQDTSFQDRTVNISYGTEEDPTEHHIIITRDSVGPGAAGSEYSADRVLAEPGRSCAYNEVGPCEAASAAAAQHVADATPNVIIGVGFVAFQGALDPSQLRDIDPSLARETPTGPLERGSKAAPASALTRDPDRAQPLPQGSPTPFEPDRSRSNAPLPTPAPPSVVVAAVAEPSPHSGAPYALAYAAAFGLAVLLAALYSRIRGRDALLSGVRSTIMGIIQHRGPTPVADIARELGRDPSTIEYHGRMLAKGGLVALRLVERRLVIFGPGHSDDAAPRRASSREHVLAILHEQGGRVDRRAFRELAASMPVRTQNNALRQLRADGKIVTVTDAAGTMIELARGSPNSSTA